MVGGTEADQIVCPAKSERARAGNSLIEGHLELVNPKERYLISLWQRDFCPDHSEKCVRLTRDGQLDTQTVQLRPHDDFFAANGGRI